MFQVARLFVLCALLPVVAMLDCEGCLQVLFELVDTNNDTRNSALEILLFALKFNTNFDLTITLDEANQRVDSVAPGFRECIKWTFFLIDFNRNKKITLSEIIREVMEVDKNGDLFKSRNEYTRYVKIRCESEEAKTV